MTNQVATNSFLAKLGIESINPGTSTGKENFMDSNAEVKNIHSPVDGSLIGSIAYTTAEEYEKVVTKAEEAYQIWRKIPAPKRGEIVRQYGNLLRE